MIVMEDYAESFWNGCSISASRETNLPVTPPKQRKSSSSSPHAFIQAIAANAALSGQGVPLKMGAPHTSWRDE